MNDWRSVYKELPEVGQWVQVLTYRPSTRPGPFVTTATYEPLNRPLMDRMQLPISDAAAGWVTMDGNRIWVTHWQEIEPPSDCERDYAKLLIEYETASLVPAHWTPDGLASLERRVAQSLGYEHPHPKKGDADKTREWLAGAGKWVGRLVWEVLTDAGMEGEGVFARRIKLPGTEDGSPHACERCGAAPSFLTGPKPWNGKPREFTLMCDVCYGQEPVSYSYMLE